MDKYYHFKLSSSEDLIAEIIYEDETQYDVFNPLISVPNGEAIILKDFIPFSTYKLCSLRKDNIISASIVTEPFLQYYFNAICYNREVIEPSVLSGVSKINKTLEGTFSKENKEFIQAAKKYNVNLKKLNQSVLN